jgi:hypothetical protein
VFNPYEALTDEKPIHSITDQVLNKNKKPEEAKTSKFEKYRNKKQNKKNRILIKISKKKNI